MTTKSSARAGNLRSQFTIADLVAMPHLALELVAGEGGAHHPVQWTHTSELEDPGPWLEGGELLIVNGFGIPEDPSKQSEYIERLAQHRLAGIAVSVRAPQLTDALLETANRLAFPVLRIPRQVPFIELSYLVANASERSARDRLSRHLQIFETLRLRNAADSDPARIYAQLEQISGYRLALVSPAGNALLSEWPWVPDALEIPSSPTDLAVVPGGYIVPLYVGDRITAYLVGIEHPSATPEGLVALQHVSTLAALDAIDDQRRRELEHRQGSAVLTGAFEKAADAAEVERRLGELGVDMRLGARVLACDAGDDAHALEIEARDWLADRRIPHVMVVQDRLLALAVCDDATLREFATRLGVALGASPVSTDIGDAPRLLRQAEWSLTLADGSTAGEVVLTEEQLGLAQWLNPDVATMERLAADTLRPILEHDAAHGSELLRTLSVYFHQHGKLRATAAQLFVHEHTLRYRLNRIEHLTQRQLKHYRDAFELWLAVEAHALIE